MIKAHVDVLVNKHKANKSPYFTVIGGKEFYILPNVYNPNFGKISLELLKIIENVSFKKTDNCLDMGTGTGIYSIKIARKVNSVLAVDVSNASLKCAKINIEKFNLSNKITIIKSDLFASIPKIKKFDYIFANIPFVDEKLAIFDKRGYLEKSFIDFDNRIIKEFLEQAPNYLNKSGKIYIANGNTGDLKLFNRLTKESYRTKTLKTIIKKTHRYYIFELTLL